MPATAVTITFDLADLIGTPLDGRRTKMWLTTNIENDTIVDTDGDQIRLGSGSATVASDGTGSVSVWVPGATTNPASWQTTFHVDYPDRNARTGRTTVEFGPYTIAAAGDLADLIVEQTLPADQVYDLVTRVETLESTPAVSEWDDLTGEPTPLGAADVALYNLLGDESLAATRVSAEAAAAAADKVDKGGSVGDGQNIRRLRRPTLLIDKMFPTVQHDHQIVHVDETAKIAYSIGQDRRLRKSSWAAVNDAADTFGPRRASSPDASSWAADGVFLRTTAGSLLMEQRDLGTTTNTVLLRSASASDGNVFSTVLTLGAGARFLGPQSVCQDATTGYLYAVEYMTGASLTEANIWRSTDDGASWSVWKAMPRSETDVAGKIRHWHSCRYDSVSQRVYFTAGDTSDDAGIYRVNSAGTDIEAVLLNSQVASTKPGARAVDIMFFPTHIAWPVDGEDPHVRRMARTEIGAGSPVSERIADLNSTGWWTQKAADDGSVWVCSSATEPLGTENDLASHLYAISDNGAQVDEIGAVAMDGNTLGYASLSGLGGGNGGGDTFWLRAHNFQRFPNTTYSAFQMRAKVVWGAAPIIKPPMRQKEIIRESRNGSASLAAGGTLTFAHSRAPFRAMRLQILNLGVKRTSGTGTVAVQIYNVTTGAAIVTYTGGQSWRTDSLTDTTEVYDSVLVSTGAQIEFRLVETGGVAAADALGFVEFGWTF